MKIRTANERKDEKLWQEYVSEDPLENIEEYVPWEERVPPIYISIPEPDKVDVWIWIYDKAGHKSEPVKLLNYIDQ